jgi:hypothetical protein
MKPGMVYRTVTARDGRRMTQQTPPWEDDIDAFLTPWDPRANRAEHGYPSEL